MKKRVFKNFNFLRGDVKIPSDKSISHRAIIFSSLADGKSVIKNFSTGKDPKSSLNICKNLGIDIHFDGKDLTVFSNGKLKPPKEILDCGNSGTTMRLMAGVLASQNFDSVLVGDESLSARPMKRIIEPLQKMGARIISSEFSAPLKIFGQKLAGIEYSSPIASAQVKSCILLAGLNAEEKTSITEPYVSRNHTEIMLKTMGAEISVLGNTINIKKSQLQPLITEIPGDISSAAYFIAAALIIPNSEISLRNVGLNPTRTGILEVLDLMSANYEILEQKEFGGELVGDIRVYYSELKGCDISGALIPKLIDEIPIIAVLATQAQGQTKISNAQDLRNKESDRIHTIVSQLKKLGAKIEETPDGMIIQGKTTLKGNCACETFHDHRLAMSLYVAGLICEKEILIDGFEWIDISFPEFEKCFESLKK